MGGLAGCVNLSTQLPTLTQFRFYTTLILCKPSTQESTTGIAAQLRPGEVQVSALQERMDPPEVASESEFPTLSGPPTKPKNTQRRITPMPTITTTSAAATVATNVLPASPAPLVSPPAKQVRHHAGYQTCKEIPDEIFRVCARQLRLWTGRRPPSGCIGSAEDTTDGCAKSFSRLFLGEGAQHQLQRPARGC